MLKTSYIKFILLFVLLVFIQVVFLNSISFLSYAIPLVYIFFIIKLPVNLNRNVVILLGFILGFTIDIFCNTPGINAAATTLVAFLRKPIMSIYFMTDDFLDSEPSISVLGVGVFMKYAVTMVLIHIIALVSLEFFSYLNIKLILLRIVCSTLLSSILILGFEGFSISNNKKEKAWRKI